MYNGVVNFIIPTKIKTNGLIKVNVENVSLTMH